MASAARLAAGASSLLDGGGELTGRLGQLFGNVDITVVEVEAAGATTRVPDGQPAYTAGGGRYTNPGLGLDIDTRGWTVDGADSTWPSTLVVAFVRDQGRGEERVELHELPALPARHATTVVGERIAQGQAVLAVPGGGTLWLYTAAGPRPRQSLRDLLAAAGESP